MVKTVKMNEGNTLNGYNCITNDTKWMNLIKSVKKMQKRLTFIKKEAKYLKILNFVK